MVGLLEYRDARLRGYSSEIPPGVRAQMIGSSWKPGCPVPLDDLRLLVIPHWDFSRKIVEGEMVLHADLADEAIEIFADLVEAEFPIERMRRIDHYGADDERSMSDNNTSSFCYRPKEGRVDIADISRHAFGRAIDINPLINPWVKHYVAPRSGLRYADRTLGLPGMIVRGDACYRAFTERDWISGIDFVSLKDYQHFEK